jgi:hypothetical protein
MRVDPSEGVSSPSWPNRLITVIIVIIIIIITDMLLPVN